MNRSSISYSIMKKQKEEKEERMNHSMRLPRPLKEGDLIALLAPSSPVTQVQVQESIQLFEKMGFQVWVGKSCTSRLHGYLAGSDSLRAKEFNDAFALDKIRGIFCIRGGYGATRLLDLLDYEMIRKHPKVFLGYSDITCIHLALQRYCEFVTYHGPMPASNMQKGLDEYSKKWLHQILCMSADSQPVFFENPEDRAIEEISGGTAEGTLCGGNLTLFTSLIGTPYLPDMEGKILFFEDIHESVPRINRMFDQLWHSEILMKCSGLLLGDFAECSNVEDPSFSILDFFRERFHNLDKPILANLQFGHCSPTATIPFGMTAKIENASLSIRA